MNTLQFTVSAPVPRSHAPAAMARTLEALAKDPFVEVTAVWGQRYYGGKRGKVDNVVVTLSYPLEAETVAVSDVNGAFAQYGKDAGVNRDLIVVQVAQVQRANVR